METFDPAPYMNWAKHRPPAANDLAQSNLLAVDESELPDLFAGVALCGDNPDGYPPLVDAIARRCGVGTDRVAVAPGASGANFLVCAALLGPNDDAIVELPAYDPLVAAARLVGARVRRFAREFEAGWMVDVDRVAEAMTDRTRLIVISSPHNPSGVSTAESQLRALGELAARSDAWVLVDQVYSDLTYGGRPEPAAHAHARCVTTNSLTKSYGLGGLRCGWAIASPEVVERVRRVRDVVDAVGVFAAEVACARAFARIDRLESRARSIVNANLDRVQRFMESHDAFEWVAPDGGTVAFPALADGSDATPFVERLLTQHDTAVTPGRFFGAPRHFRVAFGGDGKALDRGLRAMGETI